MEDIRKRIDELTEQLNEASRAYYDDASELMTKINTSSGAIAFSAPTNMVPRIEMPTACGTTSARMIPMIKPMMMRRIKLISFHFLMTFFIFSCPSIQYSFDFLYKNPKAYLL